MRAREEGQEALRNFVWTLLCRRAGIPLDAVSDGYVSAENHRRLIKAAKEIKDLEIPEVLLRQFGLAEDNPEDGNGGSAG